MSLWTEPPRIRQFRTLDEFPAPGLDALGATATQALYDSPLRQIQRRLEDSRARDPYVWEVDEDGARIVGDKPQVDRTTAIDRAKAEGVDLKIPEAGVTEDYLKLLIKRKKEYQQRQDVIDRGPKGVVFGTAQFVSALGASLLDPLNLAASFVPVGQLVAPAMALRASQAATLGARTAARAGVGAIEGAVGQALLEPLTYYSYDQEQLDYTVVDSLQNIAFGALLGSAAHTGFGLIRDKLGASAVATPDPLNKLDPGVQQEILKIRVADLLEGKTTDVTPIIRAAEAKTLAEGQPISLRSAEAAEGMAEGTPVLRPEDVTSRGADETALNADDLARAARNRNLPEADRNADFDALRDVDNTVGPEPKLGEDMQRLKEDTDEMLRQVNETAQQMNLELPELKAADEFEAKLRQYIKAVNAAANCGIRG